MKLHKYIALRLGSSMLNRKWTVVTVGDKGNEGEGQPMAGHVHKLTPCHIFPATFQW